MKYVAKLLDAAGRFVCSEAFDEQNQAEDRAWLYSYHGATSYVMNGTIKAIYKNGIRQNITTVLEKQSKN